MLWARRLLCVTGDYMRAETRCEQHDDESYMRMRTAETLNTNPPLIYLIATGNLSGCPKIRLLLEYIHFGKCTQVCQHCGALFWDEQRVTSSSRSSGPQYHKCLRTTRILKKKKLKINVHQPVDTSVVSDEERNTLPQLATLADSDTSVTDSALLDKYKVLKRFAELREHKNT